MSKRNDIKSVLIIGSGPIVIGQACEFDYSGAQACKALQEENIKIILINSNPATIMTDPGMADVTYIEPINFQSIYQIINKEKPDAILPTMGGQTALNCALNLHNLGILKKFNIEMIGANVNAILKAENRAKFDLAMKKIGLECPKSGIAHNMEEACNIISYIGFPCIIRPSFTMGGSGGGVAYNIKEFKNICKNGFKLSPIHELLIDESLLGWKEYEMEVVRDKKDNAIIVCTIENFDPMGIHTGDSITIAPAQTLTDKEYQIMRNASIAVLREIGVENGGSNVQFGINYKTGRMIVIEMNPRVSRSSALASKATGFPIAKIATKLALGYTLNELKNDVTGGLTPIYFEPVLDYVVTKVPRFNFEKFPKANKILTTQMKSIGEVMSIGRNFKESLQKALISLEIGVTGIHSNLISLNIKNYYYKIKQELKYPGYDRIFYISYGFKYGMSINEIFNLSKIDKWFLNQIKEIVTVDQHIFNHKFSTINYNNLFNYKKQGFSDARLAELLNITENSLRNYRHNLNIYPVYKTVDTCSGEFPNFTNYLYSTYEEECEIKISNKKKIIILGGGPNRIGQGIEFDYCCVHATLALQECGYEIIIINCNPETVSTDYDISDRLYFEPLTFESIIEIIIKEKPIGVIIQFGGQTPLKLSNSLYKAGVKILGTIPDVIDTCENRERFKKLIQNLNLLQPKNIIAYNIKEANDRVKNFLGYPLIIRPSYVLGGRAMEIIYNNIELNYYFINNNEITNKNPILLELFLNNAIEIDIDVISDGKQVIIGGLMQHVEYAGVHSGDSACSLPAYFLSQKIQNKIREQIKIIALELNIIGMMNVQVALKDNQIYILEVNPRASRTIPFVSKCIGISLTQIAALCMIGITLSQQNFTEEILPKLYCIKEAILPFYKFPGVDPILSPEMKSTGEVMGIGSSFEEAYYKTQLESNKFLLKVNYKDIVLIYIQNCDIKFIIKICKLLISLGFTLIVMGINARLLLKYKIPVIFISNIIKGVTNICNILKLNKINYIINIMESKIEIKKTFIIRCTALINQITLITTLPALLANCIAINSYNNIYIKNLSDLYKKNNMPIPGFEPGTY
ncbi:Carbamoyl-phosphate synthase large chain [Candidatus Johnevansia muelleri]|uniref:Carbamoyl phosphate synthase large chain n=1 Tax=Candidatus Johnevansia muelleri TaxID=1495769 RepID=A0A078KH64_9GAMM|nr:Carbamoyl-phosphate synthase large chain [Candidatus Evansia muelleri]